MSAAERLESDSGTYFDTGLKTPAYKLLPAEYRVSNLPEPMVTLLGSCVAACLYDPGIQTGGMNHFMLPAGGPGDGNSARYGVHAMELLVNGLLKRGARRNRLQAKVFGGGNVLNGFYADPIGTRNARFILEYLEAERIPLLAQDLGDVHPRKVAFFPQDGRALVRRLPSTRDGEIVSAERDYVGRLARRPVSGGVELF